MITYLKSSLVLMILIVAVFVEANEADELFEVSNEIDDLPIIAPRPRLKSTKDTFAVDYSIPPLSYVRIQMARPGSSLIRARSPRKLVQLQPERRQRRPERRQRRPEQVALNPETGQTFIRDHDLNEHSDIHDEPNLEERYKRRKVKTRSKVNNEAKFSANNEIEEEGNHENIDFEIFERDFDDFKVETEPSFTGDQVVEARSLDSDDNILDEDNVLDDNNEDEFRKTRKLFALFRSRFFEDKLKDF